MLGWCGDATGGLANVQDDEDLSTRPSSAFIAREDGNYQATELTRGPWNREHQHAGPPSALVAQAIARAAAPLGFTHMARLTVSLWRPIPIAELKVVVDTAYAGETSATSPLNCSPPARKSRVSRRWCSANRTSAFHRTCPVTRRRSRHVRSTSHRRRGFRSATAGSVIPI